jgi:hypothetical protein
MTRSLATTATDRTTSRPRSQPQAVTQCGHFGSGAAARPRRLGRGGCAHRPDANGFFALGTRPDEEHLVTITATLSLPDGAPAEGATIAQGGSFGGWFLYRSGLKLWMIRR